MEFEVQYIEPFPVASSAEDSVANTVLQQPTDPKHPTRNTGSTNMAINYNCYRLS
jgi:hypothetical protein